MGREDCDSVIAWTTPSEYSRIKFGEHLLALVVDIRKEVGAIHIVETASGKYIGMIGMEQVGNQVIVPCNRYWYYTTEGSVRLGHIQTKPSA